MKKLFGKTQKALPIPNGFSAEDIRVEASICTGERTIGFYSKGEKKLLFSELVRSDEDIEAFYKKYGIKNG